MQDSALIRRLSIVLTRRVIKTLEEESKKDPEKYGEWFKEFGQFIKEGCCSDASQKTGLGGLLRYETSKSEKPVCWLSFLSFSSLTSVLLISLNSYH
jgi:TNF receptor-associated protein 1